MKSVLFRASASLLLVAVFLMVGGAMSAAVVHDLAASHSKGVCAWMCATGGIAQPTWPVFFHALNEAEPIVSSPDRQPSFHISLALNSRAPPLSFA